MTDNLENKYRILALKKATLVMDALAESFKDETAKSETKALAWSISWAVVELEKDKALIAELVEAVKAVKDWYEGKNDISFSHCGELCAKALVKAEAV